MLPLPNTLLHSIKDHVRGVRYTIRAEAAAPGSVLPKSVRDEIGPLLALGSVVGTPALRLADGLFTRVETLATGILAPPGQDAGFPCTVADLIDTGPDASSFADRLYGPIKDLLRTHGVRQMLVSEQALDRAWADLRARHADAPSSASGGAAPSDDARRDPVQFCAALACALADARPIRKVAFDDVRQTRKHFMLAPNLYCAMVIGLSVAVVTLAPDLAADGAAVIESVDSVVDARFDRFKRAAASRDAAVTLAKAFEELLPFLP